MKNNLPIFMCLPMLAAAICLLFPTLSCHAATRTTTETVLVKIAVPLAKLCYATSPDGRKIACLESVDGRQRLAVNGVPGKPYDAIAFDTITFSPDGARLAYVARQGGKRTVVVDGKESKPYDALFTVAIPRAPELLDPEAPKAETEQVDNVDVLTFSPDGRRFAFGAKSGESWHLVLDGAEGKGYNDILAPLFSPDGAHMAYVAVTPEGQRLVLDGAESKAYARILDPLFSPDGKRLAYRAVVGEKRCVVTEAGESPLYDNVHALAYSPDGKHLAYVAAADGKQRLIMDGQEGKVYEEIGGLCFSPDSARVAFTAKVDGQWCAVVDGQEGRPYARVELTPGFSPNGKRLACIVDDGERQMMVVDTVEGRAFDRIEAARFSPDSTQLAYLASANQKTMVVLDGAESALFDAVLAGSDVNSTLLFNNEGGLIYTARQGRKWNIYTGATMTGPYDTVRRLVLSAGGAHFAGIARIRTEEGDSETVIQDGRPGVPALTVVDNSLTFSKDGAHLAYVARDEEGERAWLDGLRGQSYDSVLPCRDGYLFFDTPTCLHYLAFKGDHPAGAKPETDDPLTGATTAPSGSIVLVEEAVE